MKYKPFRVSITVLSVMLFLLAAVTMFLSGVEVHEVNESVREQTKLQKNLRDGEKQSRSLAVASNFLTNELWRFIATGETVHMENYWDEIDVAQNREKAVEKLRQLSITAHEQKLIDAAKQISDKLVLSETWAMRLAAEAMRLETASLPAPVAAVRLTPAELALSPQEQRRMALDYIFGEDYKHEKALIMGNIGAFKKSLRDRKEAELENAVARTRAALNAAQIFNAAMLLILLSSMTAVYLLVTRPFRGYARALQKMEKTGFAPLAAAGSRDTIRFAEAFNKIYYKYSEQKERLEEERFRFRVAVENTLAIVYEYKPDADEYKAYGLLDEAGDRDAAGNSVPIERAFQHFLRDRAAAIVGEDGVAALKKLVYGGGGAIDMPVLFNGASIWARITATPVYDDAGHLVKLIGKITNINSEREKELALEKMRSRDSLTGVYNKETGVRMVQSYMAQKSPAEICGMMLLDMDDFKRLNAAEGGVFADAVLMEVADILRAMTGPDDLLVRLGGDEFMLFIKDCPKSRAIVLGPRIAASIRALSSRDCPELAISASIGMCVTEVVDEYSGLYRCAESTLKYVKNRKKGQAACYLDTSNELGMMLTQVYPDRHSINEIDRTGGSREDLISFALDLLGKSKNLDDALFLLLSRVGKLYGLDRISLIEVDMEYLSCRVSRQWARNPADRYLDETYYISKDEMRALAAAYDEDGLCSDYIVGALGGVGSILHAAIWNCGVYDGVMGIERREKGYAWSAEERQVLSELVKIIASFTQKARADAISQAKTEFLSRMSHEIRTPMNAITGMTAIAKASLGDPAKALDCLNKIESANAYLLSLVNDILDMSRIKSGKVELRLVATDLSEQLKSLDELARPQTEKKGLRFSIVNGYADGRKVLADDLRLSQVLINLLSNAVKFTAAGGGVELRLDVTRRGDEGAAFRFSVSDTGIGISEDAQRRIFNDFEQAGADIASSYGGTGLGLAISSRLVQMMDGVLEVKSAPGKGSEFFFTLYFAYAPSESFGAAENRAAPLPPYDPKSKRILLVEDNELNREIAQEILALNGFMVETAVNGLRAAELFRDNPAGYFDAILMDIRMPVLDGFKAARLIRTMGKADSRSIPIIAVTANAYDEDMKQSLASGMNGHISKPIEVGPLLETLKRSQFGDCAD